MNKDQVEKFQESPQNSEASSFLSEAFSNIPSEKIDVLWAILKYKEIGVYRKVKCISSVLGVNFEKFSNLLPKDDSGRILDHKTRHLIHDILIKYS